MDGTQAGWLLLLIIAIGWIVVASLDPFRK